MTRAIAVLTFLGAVAFAVAPFVSSGFNGFAPDQFPVPQDDPPVQPAGYAFAIWGLIYLWLIVGTGFGAVARQQKRGWQAARVPLLVSLVVGSVWIAVAQVSVIWATVLIWVMLVTALAALARAGTGDRWVQREPVGAYAGWLTAASCVAVGLVLAGYGITSQSVAAYIGLGLALVIAAAMQRARPDSPAYPAAVIWALVAVIVSNLGAGDTASNAGVIALAALGILWLGGVALRNLRAAG